MKKIGFILLVVLCPFLVKAQDPDGNYNPFVNGGTISPSPLLPQEVGGTGIISFNIGNTGSDPLEVYSGQEITLTITLSYGEPDHTDPLLAIAGSSDGLFSWTYSAGTYTATQIGTIPASSTGTLTIAYKVTQNSTSPGYNGFNVNITPAPYQTTSNTQNDDAVSSYTYTELRDFGDAPGSYGSADHILDFTNYLGSVWDGESVYQSSSTADGDDLAGQDDEDGIVIPALIHRGETINIPVSVTSIGGWLNAWIDWNGDGVFADTDERIANNVSRSSGSQDLVVNVPADAVISGPTFARFRFSPSTLTSSTGSAIGGEVEDYQLSISCASPTATLSSSEVDGIFCAGTSVEFTAGGGINYEFRVEGESRQNGSSNTFTSSDLLNGQVVDVIVTDAFGCTATSAGIPNTVYPLPTPTLSSSEPGDAFCVGTNVEFTAGGGTVFDFRIGGTSVQNSGLNTYSISSLTDGQVVDVIVTDGNGCSDTSASIITTVYANPDPTLSSSEPGNVFCAGTSVEFSAGGGVNYEFRVDGISAQSGATATYITDSLIDGQIVNVIVTDENGCIAASTDLQNTVNENPTADAGVVLSAICQGETTLELGGSVGGSATGGTWSSPAGGVFLPAATSLSATWTPPAGYSGTATLVLTSSGGDCGEISSQKTQIINRLPDVTITNPDAVCSPATVDLTDPAVTAGSDPGLTFTYWTDAAGTIPYSTPSAATAGTYYISALASTGCSDINPVTVTVNPVPETPVVAVVDNCDNTSLLSTIATGSLLWNTGETTASITVNSAGSYNVTTTVNGCISAPGSGTAAPKTAPAPPEVSNAMPVNICPSETLDLSNLVTSTTPVGGSVFYKTSNNPMGADVSDETAVGTGSYYIFYQNLEECFSTGTVVTVTINNCPPDLTPTLTVNPNVMHGITSFNLFVRITELNMVNTNGAITVNIPKDSRWILTDGFMPSLVILGTTPLNNSEWTYAQDAINHVFTSTTAIPAGGFSIFGFNVTFDPGSTRGIYPITSQLVSGGGGEIRVSNNADSEQIDYFQE